MACSPTEACNYLQAMVHNSSSLVVNFLLIISRRMPHSWFTGTQSERSVPLPQRPLIWSNTSINLVASVGWEVASFFARRRNEHNYFIDGDCCIAYQDL